jgi:hypothetical protein
MSAKSTTIRPIEAPDLENRQDRALDHGQTLKVSPEIENAIVASLESWQNDRNVRQLWANDARLWTGSDEAKWHGFAQHRRGAARFNPRHQSPRSAGRRGQHEQNTRTHRRIRADRGTAAGNGAVGGDRPYAFCRREESKAFGKAGTLVEYLAAHFERIRDGDYCARLAYVERNQRHRDAFQDIRVLIRDRKRVATCLGFGPRFLHSTGQAHKGGPTPACSCRSRATTPPISKYRARNTPLVPSRRPKRAAIEVLAERDRRVLRVHLGADVAAGLTTLKEAIRQALV